MRGVRMVAAGVGSPRMAAARGCRAASQAANACGGCEFGGDGHGEEDGASGACEREADCQGLKACVHGKRCVCA